MRPKITCHMITSLDGRLHPDRWSDPPGGRMADLVERHYEAAAERLNAQGWIVGRRTMADFMEQRDAVELLDRPLARPSHIVPRQGRALAIAIDPDGRLRYETGEIDGDMAVAVLSERVTDETLAALRAAGVSYVFAGADGRDLTAALESLGEAFGIDHLLLEGGAITNGGFLAAGLIDAVSTLICPAIDGLSGVPAIYEWAGEPEDRPARDLHLRLTACEVLDGGVLWARHEVARG